MTNSYKKPDADDLKARLRELRGTYGVGDEAANRIEQLEAALTQSREEMAKLLAMNDAGYDTVTKRAVAAAYERAAEMCDRYPYVEGVKTAIRALATIDQTAALDTIRAEARAQGMQPLIDAASAVVDAMNAPDKPWDLPSRVLRELIDAIKGAKA